MVNSEGFLAEVFHPGCVGRGLDLDLRIRPAAPAPAASANPNGWAQAGPKWVGPSRAQVGGPRIHRFGPLGIEVEKQGFRTAWLITGQKFPWKNLKSGSSLLTLRDLSSHICEIILWMGKSGNLDPDKTRLFQTLLFFAGF